jgi:hypothetical protein|tara:strand:+ start:137 stop:370 length:234 start_codon:yes stop_codon:yes gene_type:complete
VNKDFDAMIARLFKTPDGKKILSHWEERYIKAPVCVPTQPAEQGFYREGQNSVIRTIQNAIKRREHGDYLPQGDKNE